MWWHTPVILEFERLGQKVQLALETEIPQKKKERKKRKRKKRNRDTLSFTNERGIDR